MLLLQQMAVLFFLMVLGYCMRKREILSAETAKFLSWLVVHVANPALILSGSIERTGAAAPKELGMCLGIAVLMFVGLILIAAVGECGNLSDYDDFFECGIYGISGHPCSIRQ